MMTKCVLLGVLLGVVGCGDNKHANMPPVELSNLSAINVSMPEDGEIVVDASAIDPEGAPLSYSASAPRHGVITGTAPVYTYTPGQDYEGFDTFTVTISDGTNAVDIPVTITVTAVDDPPIAQEAAVSSLAGGVAITLEASDIDSGELSYTVIAMPQHGTLAGDAPDLIYTPTPGYYGSDSFTFEASDGTLSSNVATVAISVNACFGHGC